MAHEPLTNRADSGDHDAITAQIAALRADIVKLAGSLQSTVTSNGTALVRDTSEGLNEAAHYVGRKGHAVDRQIEGAVAANPYLALGLAAGLGLLVGVITRR